MKKQKNRIKGQKGFTLLELMVAIFVITIGVLGGLSALLRSTTLSFISSSKLIASYLAQEGIEIVRNIRDKNWLQIHKGLKEAEFWDEGIPEGEWETDYKDMSLEDDYDGDFLKINNGFYQYSGTKDTPFKRKIVISNKTDLNGDDVPDKMTVTVFVEWRERRKGYQVTAQEELYNWR